MVKVIVVDDDDAKLTQIKQLIHDVLFIGDSVSVAKNIADAQALLKETHYDLLITDMNVPMRRGQKPIQDGGIKLIRSIDKHKEILTPTHIVGMTAFEHLAERHEAEFQRGLRYLITTHSAKDKGWREKLGRLLVHVANTKIGKNADNYESDLAIVTALQTPELDAVLKLPANWKLAPSMPGDSLIFHRGEFQKDGSSLSVVAATATRMGMPAATALATQIIQRFRPKFLAMAGIAAGVKGNYGDILVADRTWDYGSGKSRLESRKLIPFMKIETFDPDPNQLPLDDGLHSRFGFFRSQRRDVIQRIREQWPGRKPAAIECRIGPVASGAAVLENRPQLMKIKKHNRKLIGIEMETYGVFLAAQLICDPKPWVFSIKSICDFADSTKEDSFQEYASYTSAQFLYEFALDQLLNSA